jgi:hypothetical protein
MRGSRRSYSLNPEQIRCQVFRFRNCLFTAYSFTTNMKSRAFQSGPYFVAVCDQNLFDVQEPALVSSSICCRMS